MSDTGTVRSNSSSRYRTVSSGSTVDESLFGRSRSFKTRAPSKSNAICVSSTELEKIRNRAMSHSPNSSERTKIDASKKERALARKAHMLKMEEELIKRRQNKIGETATDVRSQRILKRAQEEIDKSEDIVKLFNTYCQRAAAFTIRDKQLEDKAEREKQEKNYERRMDLAMEVDRLKEIEAREKEERAKIEKRVADRKIIEEQISVRGRLRLLEAEEREQENRQMIETIKKYKEEEEEKIKKRKEDSVKAKLEIIKMNKQAEADKKASKLREEEEEEMIIAYQAQKDEKLRRREAEEAEAERKKIELQKKLLDSHTKTMDKQAELDELRARRAMEEAERKHRQKKLFEAQKRKRDIKFLHQARKQQEDERREAKEREEAMKQEEYRCTLKHAYDMAKRERDEAEATERKNNEFRKILQQQIEDNENYKRSRNIEKRQEGLSIKEKMASDRKKLEAIRDQTVEDMRSKGVDEKYFSELKSIDIGKFLTK